MMLRDQTLPASESTPLRRGFLLPESQEPKTRTCRRCGLKGLETLFKWSGAGRGNTCRKCDAARKRREREENPDRIRAQARNRYRANIDKCRERGRRKARSARGLEINRKAVAKYQRANPEKVRARSIVHAAILHGDIVKPMVCEAKGCTCAGPLHAHHPDYAQPLIVDFLCRDHHEKTHHFGPVALKDGSRRKYARAPASKPKSQHSERATA